MIDLAASHALQVVGRGGSVGILASPAVQKTKIFERGFSEKEILVHWPNRDDALLAAIGLIKSEGPTRRARNALLDASTALDAAGVELQFIACSEFSLIGDSVAPNASIMDTLDLLAQEIVDFSTGE